MANEFYNHSGTPGTNAQGSSAAMRAELQAIASGFDKLPTLTGNANKLWATNASGTGGNAVPITANTAGDLNVNGGKFTVAGASGNTSILGTLAVTLGVTLSSTLAVAGAATFSNATSPIISAKIGPAAGQQHALPAVASDTVALLAAAQTLTNKTVNLASNTLTGTMAQFNAALSDGDFVSLAGAETLTNKTLTAPTINGAALSGTLSGTPTFSGAPTFSAGASIVGGALSGTFSGSPAFSGTPTFAAGVTVNGGALTINTAGNASIELGRVDGIASSPFIDFHSGATAVDYDSRIIASSGTGVAGSGTLTYIGGTLRLLDVGQTKGLQVATSGGVVQVGTGATFGTGSSDFLNVVAPGAAATKIRWYQSGVAEWAAGMESGSGTWGLSVGAAAGTKVLTVTATGLSSFSASGLVGDTVLSVVDTNTTGSSTFTIENQSTAASINKFSRMRWIGKDTVGTRKEVAYLYPIPQDNDHINESFGVAIRIADAMSEILRLKSSGADIGVGSGQQIVNILGGSSGTAGGSATYYKQGAAANVSVGNWSAIIGGTFDSRGLLYSGGDLELIGGGGATSRCTVNASGISVTGAITATGAVSGASFTAKNIAKAWVNFNGTGVVAIRDSFNVSSITDNAVGDYTVNFTSALANANYSWAIGVNSTDVARVHMGYLANGVAPATTSLRINTAQVNDVSTAVTDKDYVAVQIFGA